MIRFQSDHNLAGLDPAPLARCEISGAGPRRRVAQGRKPQLPEAGNRRANRALLRRPNRLSNALKNCSKALFIQYLTPRDFALGASHLSWHN
jgi:hypothetical protein